MITYIKLFIGICCIYLILLISGNEEIAWYFKPFLIPFLFFEVKEALSFITKKWLLLALFFSWIGDVLLMFVDKNELFFIFGLLSFLLAHVLFIILFFKQKNHKKLNRLYFGLAILIVGVYLYWMLSILSPTLGSLKTPVYIYAFTISLMLIMAFRGMLTGQQAYNFWVILGAIIFVLSDSILAINKFFTPLPNASFLIMASYIIAQYLITKGIIKLNSLS